MKKRNLSLMAQAGADGIRLLRPVDPRVPAVLPHARGENRHYSFNTFDKVTLDATFVGLANFRHAFTGDGRFPQELVASLVKMTDVPLLLIFSYFVALLLRKKFRGIGAVKTIFFLTVILSSDLFLRMQDSVGRLTTPR